MRIALASDLHLEKPEFRASQVDPSNLPAADTVVLPGDVCGSPRQLRQVLAFIRDKTAAPIVLVLGNHEWYYHGFPADLDRYRKAAASQPNVHLLEKEDWHYQGFRFLGCTLWSDFAQGKHQFAAEQRISDFKVIVDSETKGLIQADRIRQDHREALHWLEKQFLSDEPTIVVSHHAPSFLSENPLHAHSPFSGAFCSNLEEQIDRWQPVLWLHGHLHDPVNYRIGGTRVVSNPWGYPGEKWTSLDFRLIEVISEKAYVPEVEKSIW